MNKIICINPPKFIKAILKFFSSFKKKDTDKNWFKRKVSYIENERRRDKLYNKKTPSFVGRLTLICYIYITDRNYARSTLPERRQRVQTYWSSTPPVGVLTLTFWTLGAQLRLVFLLLWLTAFPLILPFPHTLQTLDILRYLLIWTIVILANINGICNWFAQNLSFSCKKTSYIVIFMKR